MSDSSHTIVRFHRARKLTLPVVLWAFGLATTVLLIGMWGRAVSVDQATVADAAATAIDSGIARDRVETWLGEALRTATAAGDEEVDMVVESIVSRPEFQEATDILIRDFVAGVFADPGEEQKVRVETALAPLVPVIESEFSGADVPIDVDRLDDAVGGAGVIELDTGDARSVAAVAGEARGFLTWVVLTAGIALAILGALAVVLAERRFVMVRSLSIRIALSALSYAMIFRIASWALDPDRGRAPVLGSGAVVLRSNGHVFLIAAATAAVTAAIGGLIAWRRTVRRRADAAMPVPDAGDDTRELVGV